jgi:transposase IS116/IS110/IS902 family protein
VGPGRGPPAADARGLGEARLAAFLARERYSGRQQPAQLLAKLRQAAEGRVGELELATRRQLVLILVAMIEQLNAQITELERRLATAIHDHPDGPIFLSLFTGSVITAAELLAEIGDCRGRYPARDALAGDAGQTAVAIESGKRKAACFRWGCNKRLRSAFSTLADSTRHWNPWAADRYAAARARGHTTPARCAPSGVLGAGSCGAAGKTGWCTTRLATAPCNNTSPSPSRRHRAPGPTSLPPSGCSAPPSPHGRTAGPSAQRLTASRHPLFRRGVDVRGAPGGPGGVRRPGGRTSALRPELQASRPRGLRPRGRTIREEDRP